MKGIYQDVPLRYSPATGEINPTPNEAEAWRVFHGKTTAWLFNPWTGHPRLAGDVGTDLVGYLIQPPLKNECGCELRTLNLELSDLVCFLFQLSIDAGKKLPEIGEKIHKLAICADRISDGFSAYSNAQIARSLVELKSVRYFMAACFDNDGYHLELIDKAIWEKHEENNSGDVSKLLSEFMQMVADKDRLESSLLTHLIRRYLALAKFLNGKADLEEFNPRIKEHLNSKVDHNYFGKYIKGKV